MVLSHRVAVRRHVTRPGARLRAALVLAVFLLTHVSVPRPLSAQLAVFDSANFGQAVLEVAHTLNMVQMMIRDLAPMANISAALAVAQQLSALMQEVDAAAQRMTGRRSTWMSAPVIDTFTGLAAFRASSRSLCQTVTTDALQIQGLISQGSRLMNTLIALLDSVQALAGSVSGLQTVSTMLGQVSGQMMLLQTLQAGNNEATLCEQWSTAVRRDAVDRLHAKLFRDYGQVRE